MAELTCSWMGDWFEEKLWYIHTLKYWTPEKNEEDVCVLS